jgi:hypothetical protein
MEQQRYQQVWGEVTCRPAATAALRKGETSGAVAGGVGTLAVLLTTFR